MLLLLPPTILLFTTLIIVIFHSNHLKTSLIWLTSLGGAFLSWIIVILIHSRLPLSLIPLTWKPDEIFSFSTRFILDHVSWPFAVAITTICLAAVQISLINQPTLSHESGRWKEWAAILTLSGASIVAILPGDIVTLLLAWTCLDLIEFIYWRLNAKDQQSAFRLVIFLLSRLAGTLLAIWAAVISLADHGPLNLEALQSPVIPILLIAVGVRACVFPPNLPLNTLVPPNQVSGILLLLAPQAANLAVLTRIAIASQSQNMPAWLFAIALVTLISSIAWFTRPQEYQGRSFWLMTISGLTIASSTKALFGTTQAWGIVLLMMGALLMMASFRNRVLKPILLLGGLALTNLPFTPTWQGVLFYANPLRLDHLLFLSAQFLLLAGYIRYSLQSRLEYPDSERWKPGMYIFNLLLLLITNWVITPWVVLSKSGTTMPTIQQSWPGFLVLAVCAIGIFISKRRSIFHSWIDSFSRLNFSSGLILRAGGVVFRIVAGIFKGINIILEGQAGVLWAILIFILFISILAQFSLGG